MTNQQRQYRPSLDWTPDTKLPQRFARWKEEMEDEILLFEGDEKSPQYICNFIKVCSAQKQDAPAAPKQDTPAAPKQDDASTEVTAAVAPPVVSESPQQTQPYMTRSGRVSDMICSSKLKHQKKSENPRNIYMHEGQ
ncbi:hypothetical protein CAPTEDRAFT_196897 [Capitella teleta]|uniref:Uncharacterized protein n=1 Tax=Capitella teleta TaxID=283909 RepID=R7UUJ0_CAPTE|nr:hypothetical protein CAPTEDRAFT_196897 [Capitella teleta]|eukprot:ELU09843.1 hypothetical protein CAPTEDRAFT_196897 [Capitella teleta]